MNNILNILHTMPFEIESKKPVFACNSVWRTEKHVRDTLTPLLN